MSSQTNDLEVGFPEFESFHSAGFSAEAQFSKSVASTIPPRPHVCPMNPWSKADPYSTTNCTGMQPLLRKHPKKRPLGDYFFLASI